ncbi:MAG: ketoacyl-ACP synthase III [Desulfuromonadales bacterium]|jgi:3-oxoacyl-[acyl-carrier-protein] synthase-3|nr:ketoacyl-ACP synthase III [Desulfuromonadales bacterium]MDH3867891.1 ketoacyl-ACP synthase III [Desulfuromonadales bacterium]MDH4023892.1 ketoacyl-ACP synthase III [Desulfuromonadales bacterium]HKJ29412.1 ketoacyl-ACP synthase III [Desulfuromonadales bacterium]
MRNAVIRSTGSYAPTRVLQNAYFDQLLEEDVSTWLETNLKIKERRWCGEHESTADLCVEAGRIALQNAGLEASDLDLIIVGTDTPEHISPSTASAVQYRLAATNAGAFDLNAACSSFVAGLDVASRYLRSSPEFKHILVIGGYAMSRYLDKGDKKTVTLFADGAGAVLLSSVESGSRGFLSAKHHTEGQFHEWMGIYAGGTHYSVSQEALANGDQYFTFARKFPKEKNAETWTRMILSLCHQLAVEPNDVDHYFMTQININSIYETMDRLDVDRRKAYTIMERYAYTGAACIPMALDEAAKNGTLKENDLIFMVTSGGGLSFAAAAFCY